MKAIDALAIRAQANAPEGIAVAQSCRETVLHFMRHFADKVLNLEQRPSWRNSDFPSDKREKEGRPREEGEVLHAFA